MRIVMKYMSNIVFVLLIIGLAAGCSEDKNPLPGVSHPEDWNTQSSVDFHGSKVLEVGYNSCKSCHGSDLKGGKTEFSCFQCHQTYPHPDSWNLITDDNFHGKYIENNNGSTDYCKGCHGSNLQGGRSGVSCYSCHPPEEAP